MTCSLIITTYNWPEALELVLISALNQEILPDEIIIADDGSSDTTKEVIKKFTEKSEIPIIHSWQEDKGFRAAKSRNKAIAIAKSEYIVLVDGDMILNKNFIKEHKKHAQKSCFIQGSRVIIDKTTSQELLDKKIISLHLFTKGLKNKLNLIHSALLSKLFINYSTKHKGIKTCNMSFYKTDSLAVNGFNEDFIGWGREDSEFVERLYNNGIKRKNIKFNCIAYHIWHQENSRASLKENNDILENAIKEKKTWCENGINKYHK